MQTDETTVVTPVVPADETNAPMVEAEVEREVTPVEEVAPEAPVVDEAHTA